MSPQLKTAFEDAVRAKRFSELELFEQLKQSKCLCSLPEGVNLSQKEINQIQFRLVRASFFIELVNEKTTSTKYDIRWSERLSKDPRGASFDDCLKVHESLCSEVFKKVTDKSFLDNLKRALQQNLSPHEFPVDYNSKENKIHTSTNLKIFLDDDYIRLLKIRSLLLDKKSNRFHELFQKLFKKILVKSYLTDRAQTGDFKTNREKRWEAHPNSQQFALRRDCFSVELKLVEQLFCFKGFPEEIISSLNANGITTSTGKLALCPVTLDPLDFDVLAAGIMNPVHGKSAYQVAHLNPLKAGQGEEFRHHKENISWMTADGNRIQGNLTLKETRELLLHISKNYEALPKT